MKMHLQLLLQGPAERLNRTYGIQLSSDWGSDTNNRYGSSGLVIRQGQQGDRQASIVQMLGVVDALMVDDIWFAFPVFKEQQCIIPIHCYRIFVDGTWYAVAMKDGSFMNCAAIFGSWKSRGGNRQEGFVLLTTSPNVLLSPFREKMPVLLHLSELNSWLRGERPIQQELNRIASPYPSELMQVDQCITQ